MGIQEISGDRNNGSVPPFSPPWSIEDLGACCIVRDHGGQMLVLPLLRGGARPAIIGQTTNPRRDAADNGEFCQVAGVHTQDEVALRRSLGGRSMPLSGTGKAVINESEYPYIVGVAVADDELDVELSRRIMDFRRSEKFRRAMGGKLLDKAKSIFGGVFPIWPLLAH
jgi:hypothetical protein